MDLSKLSPAPWQVEQFDRGPSLTSGPPDDASERFALDDPMERADMEFAALARNAFDVMLRRGWGPTRDITGKWGVEEYWCSLPHQPDPFTALVEADKWHKENFEKA